jgi:septal ring factor EnvC (AmiA/AmiB activator)
METDETISKETHEALLDKAVRDATASVTAERDLLKAQVDTLTADKASTDTELAAVKSENERLNGELDTAQVSLKAAQDEAAALKADIASRDEAAEKATIASDRAAQVRNLGLFPEEYITTRPRSGPSRMTRLLERPSRRVEGPQGPRPQPQPPPPRTPLPR